MLLDLVPATKAHLRYHFSNVRVRVRFGQFVRVRVRSGSENEIWALLPCECEIWSFETVERCQANLSEPISVVAKNQLTDLCGN